MPLMLLYPLLVPLLWANSKTRHIIIILLISFYAIYDLVDYSTIYFGVGALAKILPEILLVGFFLLYLLQKWKEIDCHVSTGLIFVVLVGMVGIVLSPLHGVSLVEEIGELRIILRPILFFILIRKTCRFSEKQFHLIMRSFLIISGLICLIGIYQYFTFEGDYTSVWRYEPLLNAKLSNNELFKSHFIKYQIVRNDQLRASGPFYSALDFGYLAGLFSMVCYIYFMHMRKLPNRTLWFAGIVIGLSACYASGVRSAFILFVLGVAYNTLITNIGVMRRWVHITILIGLSLSLFVALGFSGSYLDASAIGRLIQLYRVASDLLPLGHGFSESRFDSAILYYINALGVLCVPLIYYIFVVLSSGRLLEKFKAGVDGKVLYIAGLGILFIMFFQFTLGSFFYNSIFILIACYLRVERYDSN